MAYLQSGNLGGGITHSFEFNYTDLQNEGFLGTSGGLTGSPANTAQVFGADGQRILFNVPFGGFCQIAGLTVVEASAGASDLSIGVSTKNINIATLPDLGTTASNLKANSVLLYEDDLDAKVAAYSNINNGATYIQTLAGLLTGSATGLDFAAPTTTGAYGATPGYSRSGETITIDTTGTNHNLRPGQNIHIEGTSVASGSGINNSQVVASVTDADTFVLQDITGLSANPSGTLKYYEAGNELSEQLYEQREEDALERSYKGFFPSEGEQDYIFMQFNGTTANLTAGRWILYFQIFDPVSLLNGPKPDHLDI